MNEALCVCFCVGCITRGDGGAGRKGHGEPVGGGGGGSRKPPASPIHRKTFGGSD